MTVSPALTAVEKRQGGYIPKDMPDHGAGRFDLAGGAVSIHFHKELAVYDSETIQGVLAIQRRAVAYGAGSDVPLVDTRGVLTWPADEERVAFDELSYDQEDDTFAAWDVTGHGPLWQQR